MSRRPPVMLILSFGAACAWSLATSACGSAEISSASAGNVDVLRAYIDPGVAGFVVVTVLGFISSIGYWARSYIARVKRRLFGRGKDCAADDADGQDPADRDSDGKARTDGNVDGEARPDANADGERANC